MEYRRKKTASSEIDKTILISSQIDEYEPEDCPNSWTSSRGKLIHYSSINTLRPKYSLTIVVGLICDGIPDTVVEVLLRISSDC